MLRTVPWSSEKTWGEGKGTSTTRTRGSRMGFDESSEGRGVTARRGRSSKIGAVGIKGDGRLARRSSQDGNTRLSEGY